MGTQPLFVLPRPKPQEGDAVEHAAKFRPNQQHRSLPAERTAALLTAVAPGLSAQAAAARTAPCWAGLFAFTHDRPAKHHAIRGSGEGTLGWLARSAQGPAWVVHETPAWSRAHLE